MPEYLRLSLGGYHAERVIAYAEAHHISKAEAARRLIELGLKSAGIEAQTQSTPTAPQNPSPPQPTTRKKVDGSQFVKKQPSNPPKYRDP